MPDIETFEINRTVNGRVVLLDTTQGVAEVNIVLYDLDQDHRTILNTAYTNRVSANISLTKTLDSNFWARIPGNRIGSVLTNQDGRFSLSYTSSSYADNAEEGGPDLVLMVLGPDVSPGLSVAERLLHFSYVTRSDSGQHESYIIAIDEEDLVKKRVPISNIPTKEFTDLQRKSVIKEKLKLQVESDEDNTEWKNNIWQWFTKSDITSQTYLKPASSNKEVKSRELQLINESLPKISEIGQSRGTVELKVSKQDLNLLLPESGDINGRVNDPIFVSACDLLAAKGFGNKLTRAKSLLDTHHEIKFANNLGIETEDETNPQDSTDTPDDSGSEDSASMNIIRNRILGQLRDLPAIDLTQEVDPRTDLEKLKDQIRKIEESSGPANVAAFHDLNSLQMAFEEIWTEAFDESLKAKALELYEATTKLHEEYEAPLPDFPGIFNLGTFLEAVGGIKQVLAVIDEVDPQPDRSVKKRSSTITKSDGSTHTTSETVITLNCTNSTHDLEEAIGLNPIERVRQLTKELDQALKEPYSFKYYAPNSINFGLITTYRQEWVPETYQVGRLVSSIPLAPGESRTVKATQKINQSRSEKEISKSLLERSADSSSTSRSELSVIAKQSSQSNFELNASGSFSVGIASIDSSTKYAFNQAQESQKQKKNFAEQVRKSSEKVRQERELSVDFKESFETNVESTQTLSNPNNEISITYLLYELERRYKVSHQLHSVTPTIMVAFDMPSPDEITEGWILEYGWILKRILLDDSFQISIEYIEDGRQADSVDIAVKKSLWEAEKRKMELSEKNVSSILATREEYRSRVINLKYLEEEADALDDFSFGRLMAAIGTLGISEELREDVDPEIIAAQHKAAESMLKYIEAEAEELSAINADIKKSAKIAADAYTSAIKEIAMRDTQIRQLQLHIRQNIFHYMHGIWSYRHQDETFFTLNDVEVPVVGSAEHKCELRPTERLRSPSWPLQLDDSDQWFEFKCEAPDTVQPVAESRRLGDIADLDNMIGFKGNYAIFPLKTCTHITDFMMQEFLDDHMGLKDPATKVGYSTTELVNYAQEVYPTMTDQGEKDALLALVQYHMTNNTGDEQTVILPTGQLYMDAIKSGTTLLEDFKLAHRGLDVVKVQEDIRSERLETLRRAGRLMQTDPDYSDPDIEKVININSDIDASIPIDNP